MSKTVTFLFIIALFGCSLAISLKSHLAVSHKSKCAALDAKSSFNSTVQADPDAHPANYAVWLSNPIDCSTDEPYLAGAVKSDGSSNWTFSKLEGVNNTFSVFGPFITCPSKYLTVSTNCDDTYVTTGDNVDCASLAHTWTATAVANRTGFYTLKSYARTSCSKTFLSAGYDDGSLVLVEKDDGSGRQHWKLPGWPVDEDLSRLNDVTSKAATKPSGRKARF